MSGNIEIKINGILATSVNFTDIDKACQSLTNKEISFDFTKLLEETRKPENKRVFIEKK